MALNYLNVTYLAQRGLCKVSNLASLGVHFPHTYSLEEEEQILNTLNSADSTGLNRFLVASRAKKLLSHRKKYGNFQSLNEVLAVEGFGFKILKSCCQSILNPTQEDETSVRKPKAFNFITPELTHEKIESMNTVVGITLGTLSVNWAGINVRDGSLSHWGHTTLPLSPDVKRHHEIQLLEAAYQARHEIPEADTYVMESCIISSVVQQSANVPVNQQRLQLSTMLLVLLNAAAREQNESQRVYFQRTSLWCRLYGTLVGSERVSSQKIVEGMLDGEPGPYSLIDVPEHLLAEYEKTSSLVKEGMCSALLLTTSFVDLNVKQLPQCISLLRGRVKRS